MCNFLIRTRNQANDISTDIYRKCYIRFSPATRGTQRRESKGGRERQKGRRESKGGRERQKGGMQHEDFPGGQMIYPRTSTENVTSDSPQLHEGRSGASQKGGERDKKEGCNTRTSQEVTHPSTTLAQARLTSEF